MPKAMVLTKQGSPDNLEMREYPEPQPGKGAIVADVKLCGVCGTDTHQVLGWIKIPMPHVIGHEWFGTVRELGEGVSTDFLGKPLKKGDPIATSIGISKQDWYARNIAGRENISQGFEEVGISMTHSADDPPHLWGGFAEQVYLPEYFPVFKLPSDLEDNEMVLIEPMAVVTRAFKRAQMSQAGFTQVGAGTDPSQTVVVQGMGPVGMCQTAVCNMFGPGNIIGIDPNADRLEKGEKLGCTETINMSEVTDMEERVKKVKSLTDGVGADIVFEAAGHPETLEESFKLVRKGGTIVELGNAASTGKAQISPYKDICQKDIDILGSFGYSALEYKTAMAALEKSRRMGLKLGMIVGEMQPLDTLPEQIRRQGEGAVPGRIAMRP